jgi:hypothetical protein
MSEETEVKVDPRDDVRQSFLPLYRWFVRQITYILRRPLHALVTAGSILVFVLLVGYALIKTQQGQDLLQLADTRWSKINLFAGLLAVLSFIEMLLFVLIFEDIEFEDKEADVRFSSGALLLLTFVPISVWCGYFYDILVGVGVYFFSVFAAIAAMIPFTIIERFRKRSAVRGAVACWTVSALILLPAAMYPTALGYRIGSTLITILLIAGWALVVHGFASLGFLRGEPGKGLRIAFEVLITLWVIKSAVVFGWSVYRGYPILDLVRTVNNDKPAALPTLGEQYSLWRKQAEGKKPTLLVVAAAGGGIRASYWTSLVLTRVADRAPHLESQLFAASGVSGGSLGLGVFYGVLEGYRLQCSDKTGGREGCIRRFHAKDFLAGPLSATFAGYPANGLLPIFPRRDDALEIGWENAWRDLAGANDDSSELFSSPFSSSEKGLKSLPLLLLNATAATSGERAMAANVRVDDWIRWRTPCHLNMAEQINLPLSAAIGASARFPFVSDPGWIETPEPTACRRLEAVSDGGFFDNYGAATLLDLLYELDSKNFGPIDLRKDINLVVVQITSDPSLDMACLFKKLDRDRNVIADHCHSGRLSSRSPPQKFPIDTLFPNEEPIPASQKIRERVDSVPTLLSSSFFGSSDPSAYEVLMQARSVNGIFIADELRRRTCELGGSYYHFGMTTADPIPLGWSLSKLSQDRLEALLSTGSLSQRLDRLVTDLNSGEGKGQCSRAEQRENIRYHMGKRNMLASSEFIEPKP